MGATKKTILFLQGPPSKFCRRLADRLERRGARCLRVNLCFADWWVWRGRPAVNYRGSIGQWEDFLERYIREHGVTDLLYYADRLPYHEIARRVAGRLGIHAITYEFGYLRPDWITVERGGMSCLSHFPLAPESIVAAAQGLPAANLSTRYPHSLWAEAPHEVFFDLSNYFDILCFPKYQADKYYNPVREYVSYVPRLLRRRRNAGKASRICREMSTSGRPYFLFPLQLQNDYQIRRNSPFEHQVDAVRLVVEAMSTGDDPGWLLIKMHPLDNGIERWHDLIKDIGDAYGMADRLLLVDGGDLDRLTGGSRGVITINSTVGIHALQAMVPVKVLGYAMYDIDGLTSQQSLAEYLAAPAAPNPNLVDAFVRLLAASIQVKGNFYSAEGSERAIDGIADKVMRSQVNEPAAFVDPPPRLRKYGLTEPGQT